MESRWCGLKFAMGAFGNIEMIRQKQTFSRGSRSRERIDESREHSIGSRLGGAAMIKVQHAAEALTADDGAGDHTEVFGGIDDLVIQTLMVSFPVIMRKIPANCISQLRLAEKDHSIQALGFNASHKPFDVRIEVGRSRGQEQRFGTRLFQRGPKRFGEFCVPVHQDVLTVDQKSVPV